MSILLQETGPRDRYVWNSNLWPGMRRLLVPGWCCLFN